MMGHKEATKRKRRSRFRFCCWGCALAAREDRLPRHDTPHARRAAGASGGTRAFARNPPPETR